MIHNNQEAWHGVFWNYADRQGYKQQLQSLSRNFDGFNVKYNETYI